MIVWVFLWVSFTPNDRRSVIRVCRLLYNGKLVYGTNHGKRGLVRSAGARREEGEEQQDKGAVVMHSLLSAYLVTGQELSVRWWDALDYIVSE